MCQDMLSVFVVIRKALLDGINSDVVLRIYANQEDAENKLREILALEGLDTDKEYYVEEMDVD